MPLNVRRLAVLVITFMLLFGCLKLTSQNPEATTFCALHHFGAPPNPTVDGLWPIQAGALALAPDGSVWTTTNQGGAHGVGAVVKVTADGYYSKVADFDTLTTGSGPQGGLVYGNNNYMYGTTYAGGKWGPGTIFRISVQGGPIEVIYDFRNGRPTGIQPKKCITPQNCQYSPQQRRDFSASYPVSAPVVQGNTLYGVTSYSNNQQYGTFYSIPLDTAPRSNTFTAFTPEDGDEKFHVSCMFQPSLANDPEMAPFRCNTKGIFAATLVAGNDGNFYGTTYGGYGSIFKATATGNVMPVHDFNVSDGSKPFALIQGSDGYLYGTTIQGGKQNWGVVYKAHPLTGSFSVLTDFPKPVDNSYAPGYAPMAGVVEAPDHYLYGVNSGGGKYGWGTFFRIAMDGTNYATMRDFDGGNRGAKAVSTPLLVDNALYGTTYGGGLYYGGVFYRFRLNRVSINGGLFLANDGVVQVLAPTVATQAPTNTVNSGIAVQLKCANGPHFVQFIYREMIQPASATVSPGGELFPYGKLLDNPSPAVPCCQTSWGEAYPLTTVLTDLHWNADEPLKPSPYFEDGHSAELDCDSLTLFDRPQLPAIDFDLANHRVARAVARDYAMCGGQVQRQVTWIADQTTDATMQPHWKYQATISPASKIPDYFLCLLKNNNYDLPQGQTITPGFDCSHLDQAVVGKP